MTQTKPKMLGTFTKFDHLSREEKKIVKGTWQAAKKAYVPRSHFPVGSVILAENEKGERKLFSGCNVENRFFAPTICAERNAVTSAIAEGYNKIIKAALVCEKYQGPGASPCGLCRQVLVEFGSDATMFNLADTDNNVYEFSVLDLLPAASADLIRFGNLTAKEKRLVRKLFSLKEQSYVPYSKQPKAAIFIASNEDGKTRRFYGVSDDNSSYGGSASAENVAMRSARTAGFIKDVTLVVTVDYAKMHNPIDGECLQVLREFGLNARVILVGEDRSLVTTTVDALLPDSFGPEALQ